MKDNRIETKKPSSEGFSDKQLMSASDRSNKQPSIFSEEQEGKGTTPKVSFTKLTFFQVRDYHGLRSSAAIDWSGLMCHIN